MPFSQHGWDTDTMDSIKIDVEPLFSDTGNRAVERISTIGEINKTVVYEDGLGV